MGNEVRSFEELLAEKANFLEDILGKDEFEKLKIAGVFEEGTVPLHPHTPSRGEWEKYWRWIIKKFSDNDSNISLIDSGPFTTTTPYIASEQAADSIVNGLFNPSHSEGLGLLVVGCYNTALFNQDYVADAARSFLDAARSKGYMLISASNREVMVQPIDQTQQENNKRWENKFLELITDDRYKDVVYPVILPERVEFQFFARLSRHGADKNMLVEFEPAHSVSQDIRAKVKTESEKNFYLAFRSFVRYALNPPKASQVEITRDLNSFKKHRPEFFPLYRLLPSYLVEAGAKPVDYMEVLSSAQSANNL